MDYILEIINTSTITAIVDEMEILFRIHEVNKYMFVADTCFGMRKEPKRLIC